MDVPITLELAVLRLVEQHNESATDGAPESFASPAAIFWRIQYTAPHLWTTDQEQMVLRVNWAMRSLAQKRELVQRGSSEGPPVSRGFDLTDSGRQRLRRADL